MTTPLLLIGCGNMGGALLVRWQETLSQKFSPIHVVEANAKIDMPHVKKISDLPQNFSPAVIVLAVKPQQMEELLPQAAERFGTTPTYLSIAAGKTLAFYEKYLGQGAGIVRAMPNTPAMVGKGMTALIGNSSLTKKGREQGTALMSAVGEVLWLEHESQMDAVTAISGSGPAYFFYFMECLTQAGIKQGLSKEDAEMLALATCAGSAELAHQHHIGFEELRRQVTSPGGTTEAALKVLQHDHALKDLVEKAVAAAVLRAQAL